MNSFESVWYGFQCSIGLCQGYGPFYISNMIHRTTDVSRFLTENASCLSIQVAFVWNSANLELQTRYFVFVLIKRKLNTCRTWSFLTCSGLPALAFTDRNTISGSFSEYAVSNLFLHKATRRPWIRSIQRFLILLNYSWLANRVIGLPVSVYRYR